MSPGTTIERPLLVLGARSFAPEVADLATEVQGLRVVAFVENVNRGRCGGQLAGLPVVWVDDLVRFQEGHWAVCALGSPKRRGFVEQAEAYGIPFATLLHPTARISSRSSTGQGCILSAGVIVAAYTQVGRHVILNRGALIGHHTTIGDYVTIGPGANVAASCRIGDATYIGMGAIVIDHVTIGSHSVVGAGALVTKDVPDNVHVVGAPARIVRHAIDTSDESLSFPD